MCDAVSCCKECGNPLLGIVYIKFKEELKKLIVANHRDPHDLLVSCEVDFKDNRIRELMDDLGIIKECCRVRLLTN
jgi:DNA-directed RNA polymerase subunit N (RpoN/RPB10)